MVRPRPAGPGLTAELTAVAEAGARDAGGLDPALLGDFLPIVIDTVAAGRSLTTRDIVRFNNVGKAAAGTGVALRALLDLYLSAAWRLWDHLPEVVGADADPQGVVRAGRAVLRAADDVVAALTEGYQLARRELIRADALGRREFVDDLLSGSRDVAGLIDRAAGFGLTLAGSHAVAVVRARVPYADENPLNDRLERALLGTKADSDALITTKNGQLVVVFAAPDRAATTEVIGRLTAVLPGASGRRATAATRTTAAKWQMGVGRPHPGAAGVRRSLDEALEALDLGGRLGRTIAVLDASDMLVYRVLVRDEEAIRDLVESVLTPLSDARGGAAPLIETLSIYYGAGSNTTATARAMHLSVRAVSYRLNRVRQLTGHHPDDPAHRFTLHAAVLGARLLGWPATLH